MAEPIEPRGCPTPGACSCYADAAIRDRVMGLTDEQTRQFWGDVQTTWAGLGSTEGWPALTQVIKRSLLRALGVSE